MLISTIGPDCRRCQRRTELSLGHRCKERRHPRPSSHHQRRYPDLRCLLRQRIPLHRIAISLWSCAKRPSTAILTQMLEKWCPVLLRGHHGVHILAHLPERFHWLESGLSVVPESYDYRTTFHLVLCLLNVCVLSKGAYCTGC